MIEFGQYQNVLYMVYKFMEHKEITFLVHIVAVLSLWQCPPREFDTKAHIQASLFATGDSSPKRGRPDMHKTIQGADY